MKSSAGSVIRLKGVRHNNLKNFDLDLPLNQLIVITGLSGSGKSSLAFDTLFAEGQRRYIETFSPYARQFLDRMDKPQVDSIEGIPPAIAIEQRNAVKTTRSTVGTMTEVCDYMKMLWPHISQLHCRQCGQPVRKDSPQAIWEAVRSRSGIDDLLVTFDVPLSEKLSLEESLALIARQGYQRLLLNGKVARLDEAAALVGRKGSVRVVTLTVIQDRLKPTPSNRARFIEACEQAYHFGKGKLTLHPVTNGQAGAAANEPFSNRLHCAKCDIEYREPSPALFSFNNPLGACPNCRGFGRIISIDYNLALPDRSRTLAEGVVKPWMTGQGMECQTDLLRMCRQLGIPTNVPFAKLADKWQKLVVEGEPDYGKDEEHQWPRAWYGVKGYFRWLESKAYKMHVRVLLSRYRSYTTCPDCEGRRFQPEGLLYMVRIESVSANGPADARQAANERVHSLLSTRERMHLLTLADFYALPIRDALKFMEVIGTRSGFSRKEPLGLVLNEVRSRLEYLNEVGLGYLTLDRPTRSLSGGETERVNLTTCLGTCLVNTLFVLDEPSVGLHPRDTDRLVHILKRLRDAGNTVVVVEHEASVMRAANQLVDLGPGQGAAGGRIVFQGNYDDILKSADSLTGAYLSGNKHLEVPERRPVAPARSSPPTVYSRSNAATASMVLNDSPASSLETPFLTLSNANRHNLKHLSVSIPLDRFVCLTGVSGSGKTTLIREVLVPALAEKLRSNERDIKASERFTNETNGDDEDDSSAQEPAQPTAITGWEHLQRVALVDQSILGKTPRSNPAVYIGAFDHIREFFAASETARQRGLNASAFSFNSAQGQCERCRGAGFEKIEMQFLSDIFIRCPDCNGRRYRSHILDVKILPPSQAPTRKARLDRRPEARRKGFSIADLLDSTIDQAAAFLALFPEVTAAKRALAALNLLQEVGLGYLKLGQPINTLSGGESQRLKLVRHLADATASTIPAAKRFSSNRSSYGASSPAVEPGETTAGANERTLFLFDEPTTGLHFDDVRVLLKVFQRLVDAGHSVLVIEHNLDVIKSADWLIDLGPDAGDQGGQVVAEGTPEQVMACPASHTGRALREHMAATIAQEKALTT